MEEYPFKSGDVWVLGPEVFVSEDGRVINWRGENYYAQEPVEDYNDYEPLE